MADTLGNAALKAALKRLGAETITQDDAGILVTRAERLAQILWDYALGWTETKRDANGSKKKVEHAPVAWAMQYVFERLEGKAAQATQENETGVRAVDKVRELAKDRINKLASDVAGPPKSKRV